MAVLEVFLGGKGALRVGEKNTKVTNDNEDKKVLKVVVMGIWVRDHPSPVEILRYSCQMRLNLNLPPVKIISTSTRLYIMLTVNLAPCARIPTGGKMAF